MSKSLNFLVENFPYFVQWHTGSRRSRACREMCSIWSSEGSLLISNVGLMQIKLFIIMGERQRLGEVWLGDMYFLKMEGGHGTVRGQLITVRVGRGRLNEMWFGDMYLLRVEGGRDIVRGQLITMRVGRRGLARAKSQVFPYC